MRLAENAAALDNRSVSGGGNLQFQWCATRGPTIEARAWAVFYRDDVWPIFHTRRRQGEFGHAPLLMAAAFGSIMIGYIASRVLLRYTRVADATAFFTSAPDSTTEMANLGDHFGAAVDKVAVAHSLRILLVVCTVPVFMTISDVRGGDVYQPVVIAFNWTELIQLFAIAAIGGAPLSWIGLPDAWMTGSLVATIVVTASGFAFSSTSGMLTNAG